MRTELEVTGERCPEIEEEGRSQKHVVTLTPESGKHEDETGITLPCIIRTETIFPSVGM